MRYIYIYMYIYNVRHNVEHMWYVSLCIYIYIYMYICICVCIAYHKFHNVQSWRGLPFFIMVHYGMWNIYIYNTWYIRLYDIYYQLAIFAIVTCVLDPRATRMRIEKDYAIYIYIICMYIECKT